MYTHFIYIFNIVIATRSR